MRTATAAAPSCAPAAGSSPVDLSRRGGHRRTTSSRVLIAARGCVSIGPPALAPAGLRPASVPHQGDDMARPILLTLLLLLPFPLRAEDPPPPEESDIVPKGAKLEKPWTRKDNVKGGLTEGPSAGPDGSIYFTDIRLGKDKSKIMRFDPKTKETTVFAADSGHANGLMFDAKGYLIACEGSDMGGRCVSRWDVKTKKRTVIVDNYKGKKFNAPNDLCIDLKGRIYFTDPRYLGDEPRELTHRAVYRINTDGTVEEITHDVEKPNGIDISPDQKTLYVVDHN